jgi:hypothetical protein
MLKGWPSGECRANLAVALPALVVLALVAGARLLGLS